MARVPKEGVFVSKSSIRVVGDSLIGKSKHHSIGSFVSSDGTAIGFVDAGVDNEFGEKICDNVVVAMKSLISTLHVEKREFLWHPNDHSKAELCERMGQELKDCLSRVYGEARMAQTEIPQELGLAFVLGAGETVFLARYGSVHVRSINETKIFTPSPAFKVEVGEEKASFIEIFVLTLSRADKAVVFSGDCFLSFDKEDPRVFDDYRVISNIIRKARGEALDSRGGIFLLGVDDAYQAAIDRGYEDIADALSKSALFRDLDKEEIASLLVIAEKRTYKTGEFIYNEGSEGVSILVLVSGAVGVYIESKEHIVRKKPGETFGESGFLEGLPRSGSLLAKTDVVLFEIFNDHLWDLIRNKPLLGVKILTRIASNTARKRREASARLNELESEKKLSPPKQTPMDKMTPADSRHWVQACARALRSSAIFQDMDANEISFILGNSTPKQYQPGALILKEGSDPGVIYLGLSGKLKISSLGEQRGIINAFGEVIGEVEFMDRMPIEKAVSAVTEVNVLEIPYGVMADLINSHPKLGTKVLWSIGKLVSQKLRENAASNNLELDIKLDEDSPVVSMVTGERRAQIIPVAKKRSSG